MILTGETDVLGEKHYIVWVVGEWMGVERWWNDTDRGNWCTGRVTVSGCFEDEPVFLHDYSRCLLQAILNINTLCRQNAVLFNGTPAGGTYSNHWAVNDDAQYMSKPQYHICHCVTNFVRCHVSWWGAGAHVAGLSALGFIRIKIFALMTTKLCLQIMRYTSNMWMKILRLWNTILMSSVL